MKKIFRLLPILIIIAACAVFFYPTITKKLLPVPTDTLIGLYHPWLDQVADTNPSGVPFKNFLITDPVRQLIPWRKLVIDDLKKGTLPVWNPYNFSGTPLMANIQAGTWYPLNVLFYVFPFYIGWTLLIIAQPILAALFLYLFLRNKKIHPWVAALAGIVWAFCGFSIAWLTWGTIVQTALWLPLLLLSMDHILEEMKRREIALWSVVLALSSACVLFAGHAQVALYTFAFAGAYGLFSLWHTTRKNRIGWLVSSLTFAAIISSIQWVPFMQLVGHSSRITDTAAWLKEGWFLPWQNLVQFIAPDFFGNPATLNYWGVWNYGEFIGYIGILPLLLAFYGVIVRKDRLTRFIEIVLAAVLLFVLPTPIAKLPFELRIPVLFTLQPTRLMVLVDFCLVLLAALGLDAYLKNASKKILVPIILVGAALGGFWIYVIRTVHAGGDPTMITNLEVTRRNLTLPSLLWVMSSALLTIPLIFKKSKNTLFVITLILVILFDLFRFGWKFTPFTPVGYFFPVTKAISFLREQRKPFRVMSLDNRILPPNVGAYYGIESIEGYDPVYDARYEEFIAALNRREPNITSPFGFNRIITSSTIDSPLFPLLNVRYVLTLDDVKNPDLTLAYREGNTRIYLYKKALPRLYPVASVIDGGSKQQVMSALYDKTFDPDTTAVVESNLNLASVPISANDKVRITSYSDSKLEAVTTFTEGHLVIDSTVYDPHWNVTVDGVATPTYRTNYTFIGFFVPKGTHTLRIVYE